MSTQRYWVLVASRDHARRGLEGGFVMANHGKRAPMARMSRGDAVIVYSPTTTFPKGEPLRAVTFVGEVTGDEPEPSTVIPGGFRRRAALREVAPVPLADIREHLPTASIRFGFFELDAAAGEAVLARAAPR
ncbi:EVE domain-containing protein [Phycicoccus sp. HDW14]|uniref:EVE domain-containing protein n=1 Tax=Phycicoccus sp. HDW14 TaxID=2714941 RepID=UPI00140DA92F|nr:EVE domain-containing protein [Phycicoccus sp. HDW14]QIM22349.1 EVE domain-containing protein [Phycicoccus sp. HDW14]